MSRIRRLSVTVVVLVGLLALVGGGPAQAQPARPVELTLASGFAPTHVQAGVIPQEWSAEVEKATKGRVKIKGVYGGSLLGPTDTLDGVRGGIADLGLMVPAFWPGQFPLTSALSGLVDLGLVGKLDLNGSGLLALKLYEEFPAFSQEYKRLGIRPLLWLPTVPYRVITTFAVRTTDDLKGVKIRAFGSHMPRLVQAVGAVPVTVGAAELYTSLQTGVVRGAITDPLFIASSKIYEPARHILDLGPKGGTPTAIAAVFVAINEKSWDKIAPDDQKAILEMSRRIAPRYHEQMAAAADKALEAMTREKVTVTQLPDAEVAKWAKASPDWYALIAKDLDGKGLPGTEIAKRYQALVKDYAEGRLK